MNAQEARGSRFRKSGIRNLMKTLSRSLPALINNSVRRGKVLALAMETRAFGASKRRTALTELQITRKDMILIKVTCVVTPSTVALAALFPNLFV